MAAVVRITRKEISLGSILGEITVHQSISGQATYIGHTLEIPWRDNDKDTSSIPTGRYSAFVRTDGTRGWRLELRNVPGNRTNVQIHKGNTARDSIGCILPGLGKDVGRVTQSVDAMALLKKALAPELRGIFPDITVEITDPKRIVDYYPTSH